MTGTDRLTLHATTRTPDGPGHAAPPHTDTRSAFSFASASGERVGVRGLRLALELLSVSTALILLSCTGCNQSKSARNPEESPQVSAADAREVEHLFDDVKKKATHTATRSSSTSDIVATTTAASGDTRRKSSDPLPGRSVTNLNPNESVAVAVSKGAGSPEKLPIGKQPPFNASPGKKPAEIKPRKVEILVKERVFQTEGKNGALRVLYEDLDLLRVMNMDPVTVDCDKKMPDWLKQLNGKKIRIRGFMRPTFSETDIKYFILASDLQACCFGPNTKIYHLIDVFMKPDLTADFLPQQALEVEGTFKIAPESGDNFPGTKIPMVERLYILEDAEIIKKPR